MAVTESYYDETFIPVTKKVTVRVFIRDETDLWPNSVISLTGKMYGVYLYNPRVIVDDDGTSSHELYYVKSLPENFMDQDELEWVYDQIEELDHEIDRPEFISREFLKQLPTIKPGTYQQGTYVWSCDVNCYDESLIEAATERWEEDSPYDR